MTSRRLNALDASWLYVEARDAPMHVGGLMVFQLPDGTAGDFCQKLVADYRSARQAYPPWNSCLRSPSRLKRVIHVWDELETLDTHCHVRSTRLVAPGDDAQLSDLVALLHRQPLALKRPPWECHVIDGLSGGRFALYVKIHHSLVDGVGAMKLLDRALARHPGDASRPPFWAVPAFAPAKAPSALAARTPGVLRIGSGLQRSVPALARAAGTMWAAARNPQNPLGAPFKAPASVFNGRIGGARGFVTHSYSLPRLKKLAKAADCTVNDIVLACCGGALRRFLLERAQLPGRSLSAGVPVSVRAHDDDRSGNAISFMIASLGTDIDDPFRRLLAVRESTMLAKQQLRALPRETITPYTVLLMSPYIAQLFTGMAGRTRPVFNITVSNVPGPRQTLYLKGARLVASFPVSLVTHGQALNITCQSYEDALFLGLVACRETIPDLPRLADCADDALRELEETVQSQGERFSAAHSPGTPLAASGARAP